MYTIQLSVLCTDRAVTAFHESVATDADLSACLRTLIHARLQVFALLTSCRSTVVSKKASV